MFWRRSLRRHDSWMSHELDMGHWGSSPHSWPWTLHSAHRLCARTQPEIVVCCWDHRDDVSDWTQVRPPHKLSLDSGKTGAGIYSSCDHPRQVSCLSSLVYHPCHLEGFASLFHSSLPASVWGLVYNFTQEVPEVANKQLDAKSEWEL